MRFDEAFLDELKARLSPSEVIGKTVRLRKNGREWVGLSPFSKEKTPSFYVNDQKGFYHDFSSGKHGDIISFLQETQRLSFTEAVESLALMAGMAVPKHSPQDIAQDIKRQSLNDWMELAAKWFQARLMDKTPQAQAARDYLKKRGLSPEDIAHFGLGYAPKDHTGLKDALVQKGASVAELVECGLLINLEGRAPYDRFRDRLIFPIEDQRGRVVSFGGRALNPDEKAKYLNGPDSPLFHKGHMVFGLPKALKILGAGGSGSAQAPLVVVEGYMDVLACQRAHIAAVAPMGTALTEEQIDILWRRHPEPTLCFDGDGAGIRAAYRALDRALPKLQPGRSFKVCHLANGQDPDDLLREKGPLALREALEVTRPFVEVLFKREWEQEPLDTPERKAGFKKRLRALAAQIEDKDLAQSYREDLLERYERVLGRASNSVQGFGQSSGQGAPTQSQAPQTYGAPFGKPRPKGPFRSRFQEPELVSTPEGIKAAQTLSKALDGLSAALAQAVLERPSWIEDHIEALEAYGFGDPILDPLVKTLVNLSFSTSGGIGGLDRDALNRHVQNQGLGALLSGIQKAALKSGAPFLAPDILPADAQSGWLKAFDAMARLTSLDRALNSAKNEASQNFDTDVFTRLKFERDSLRKSLKSGQIWENEPQ